MTMTRKELLIEAARLEAIALDLYNLDGGEMYECTEREEYIALIEEHGSAEKAWEHELVGAQLRAEYAVECAAAYEY